MSPRSTRAPRQVAHAGHTMAECPDIYYAPDGRKKRRQRACKVCSLLTKKDSGKPRRTTKFYCDACSEGDKR